MADMPLWSQKSRLQGEDCCPLIPCPTALKYIPTQLQWEEHDSAIPGGGLIAWQCYTNKLAPQHP